MDIGFTGSRKGMSERQTMTLTIYLLLKKRGNEDGENRFHNGLAIGADALAARIARGADYWVIGYPSNLKEYTCDFIPDEYAQDPKPPLDRNKDIVAASDIIFAAPSGYKEVMRSGTWATIREAIRQNVPVNIVYPDGSFSIRD